MSSDALAVVREFCDVVAAADFARIEDSLDPDVVWFGTRGGLDQNRVIRGPKAVLDYVTEIRDPWERLDLEVQRLIEARDAVVVFWREIGRPQHGDLEVQSETAMVFKVRHGKILEATGYLDRDEALRAVRPAD